MSGLVRYKRGHTVQGKTASWMSTEPDGEWVRYKEAAKLETKLANTQTAVAHYDIDLKEARAEFAEANESNRKLLGDVNFLGADRDRLQKELTILMDAHQELAQEGDRLQAKALEDFRIQNEEIVRLQVPLNPSTGASLLPGEEHSLCSNFNVPIAR